MASLIVGWTPFDPWHLLVLGVIALLLFGKRLPEVGRSLGKGISEFKKGLHDVQDELSREEPPEPPRQRLQPPSETERTAPREIPRSQEQSPGTSDSTGGGI